MKLESSNVYIWRSCNRLHVWWQVVVAVVILWRWSETLNCGRKVVGERTREAECGGVAWVAWC